MDIGFYAVKSTPETIRTWDLTYRLCSRSPRYDDQTIFWLILRTNVNPRPRPLVKCPYPDVYYATKRIQPTQSSVRYLSLPNKSNVVTTCPLDDCMFSAGNIRDHMQQTRLIDILRSRKDFPVMVHANWLSGKENKKSAMSRAGLWIARRVGLTPATGAMANKSKQKSVSGNWTCMPLSGAFRDFTIP